MRPYVAELSRIASVPHLCASERRPAERVRRLRRDAGRHVCAAARVRARRLPQHRRILLRLDARAHEGDRRRRCAASSRVRSRRRGAAPRFSGLEPFEIGEDTGFVLIGERTNVTGSARFRRLVEADDFNAAVDVALEQVRGGANLIDVNMDADLLEGEQAMRTFLNVIATEPEVARLPVMVDSSKWTVIEAGLQCAAGQGHRQLDLAQGRRGGVPAPRAAHPRLRRGRRRDGVRRGGPGRPTSSAGSRSAAAPTTCSSARSASRPRTSSSTRTCSRSRPGSRSTTTTRARSSSACRRSRSAVPASAPRAASRTSASRSAATTSCARRCTRRSSTTRFAPVSTWASSTPASSRSTRTSSPSCSSASRT